MFALRFLMLPLAVIGTVATGHAETAVPDYGRPEYWTQVFELPGGAMAPAANPQVDVFSIHPTTTRSAITYNHDPLDPAGSRWTDESAVQRQASAFSGCCRIFAPRYRAATTGAPATPALREAAFALAYSGIERAFDWYLAHENKGRPYILAGHSQGAAHVASLIEKHIQGAELQQRLVAGYIIGINLMESEFGLRFKDIAPCLRPAQTKCIMQWNAVLAGSDLGPMNAAYDKALPRAMAIFQPENPYASIP